MFDRRQLLDTYADKFIIHRKMWEAAWEKRNSTGLSISQTYMIALLKDGPLQPKELMEQMAVTSGGVTVIANQLIRKGMIRRTKNDKDRRGVFLELTDEGREFYEVVKKERDDVMDEIFAVLTDIEVAILARIFTKLVDGE